LIPVQAHDHAMCSHTVWAISSWWYHPFRWIEGHQPSTFPCSILVTHTDAFSPL